MLPLCFQRYQLLPAQLFSFLGSLYVCVNDLVVFDGGKGTNIWGEEKVVDDLPIDSDNVFTVAHELWVSHYASQELCSLTFSWGICNPC